MGAYFTVRTAKSPSLFSPATARESDSKATLRTGKLMAKAFAASFEEKDREAVARTLTTAIISTYWNNIQQSARMPLPLPEPFVLQEMIHLPDAAYVLARTMGDAASTLDPLAAAEVRGRNAQKANGTQASEPVPRAFVFSHPHAEDARSFYIFCTDTSIQISPHSGTVSRFAPSRSIRACIRAWL